MDNICSRQKHNLCQKYSLTSSRYISDNIIRFECAIPTVSPHELLKEITENNEGLYLLQVGTLTTYYHIPICACNHAIEQAYEYVCDTNQRITFFELVEVLISIGARLQKENISEENSSLFIMTSLYTMNIACDLLYTELSISLENELSCFEKIFIDLGKKVSAKLGKTQSLNNN